MIGSQSVLKKTKYEFDVDLFDYPFAESYSNKEDALSAAKALC